ncbi:MAG TPA: hypothetical protein VG456_02305 [Candidatus Sulfopaludibacter sp.]|jgi:hypothetical protein|nr:hypothetical protein [Candidatus Sulfopaludibacter sp.]
MRQRFLTGAAPIGMHPARLESGTFGVVAAISTASEVMSLAYMRQRFLTGAAPIGMHAARRNGGHLHGEQVDVMSVYAATLPDGRGSDRNAPGAGKWRPVVVAEQGDVMSAYGRGSDWNAPGAA